MTQRKILIAGGGIGGLSAAIALLQRGFDVEIFEQAAEVREFGAGIQISPNGNRALDSLGVFQRLRTLASDADSKEIRLWNTGKTWTLFNLGDAAVRKYGYPYLTVFRPDLLRVLADEVTRLKPNAIHLDAHVVSVDSTPGAASLTLSNGQTHTGTAIIGADGVYSKVRAALFGQDETTFSGMVAWRTLLPMEVLPERLRRNVALNWVGPGGHIVHYPVQGGKVMNFVGTLEGNTWASPPWRAEATREDCLKAFEGWHEDIQAMLEHATSVTRWALCTRTFLTTWSKGNATLLGDACHATLPFLAQGAVHSIEDGIVLARCLASHPAEETELALQRYDQARRPRTYRMVQGASDNTGRFHNPALADPVTAEEFISREWQAPAVSDRYDWLFNYNADTAEI